MMPLEILGTICAIVALIDCAAAIVCCMRDRLPLAWILLGHYALLGSLLMLGVFG